MKVRVPLFERNGWTLESYGIGAAYLLRQANASGSRSIAFHGDSAAVFRHRYNSAAIPEFLFLEFVPSMTADQDTAV